MEDKDGLYTKAYARLEEEIPILRGRWFTVKELWEMLGITNHPDHRPFKRALGMVIYNVTHVNKKPLLKQDGRNYRVVNRDVKEIEWWVDDGRKSATFNWLEGRDGSSFGFTDSILLYPGDTIVCAGEGNKGKTALALNILMNNLDNFNCTYFSSEFNDVKFRNRIKNFDWVDMYRNDRPKFELLPKQQYYEDMIADRKDNLIFVDWVKEENEPWRMREKIEAIKQPLDNGICWINLQKRSYKNVGEGGEGTVDLADVYLTLMYEKIEVIKVKTPNMYDPNGKMFGFSLAGGCKFNDIREIIKCPACNGRGEIRGNMCAECFGRKTIDK